MALGFPDVELALCDLLEHLAPTVTATDEELVPPVIQVARTGGGSDRPGLQDSALVEITCFAATRPASAGLNTQVRAELAGAYGVPTAHGFLDRIGEFTAPVQIPDPNQDIRKVPSTWTVVSRLQQLPD